MNVLCATQGLGLRLLSRIVEDLRTPLGIERAGFYVCDSMFFREFTRDNPAFLDAGHVLLKEWELMAEARTARADVAWLAEAETRLGAPLWDALLCDRRIMLGRWCKEHQDYRPRFTHDEMLRILYVALTRIERMLDDVRPGVVLSFVPVSFGEYLLYLAARARQIPTLFLYPTKIRNYMAWMASMFGRPDHIVAAYEQRRRDGRSDEWTRRAVEYLDEAAGREVRHEGMIAIPGKIKTPSKLSRLSRLRAIAGAELEYWRTESRRDNHCTPIAASLLQREVMTPLRRRRVAAGLKPVLAGAEALRGMDFAFYPMQSEPEIALTIHGRPYQNQIETVRNVARSLPAGMKVVVKEHPRSIGYRPLGYYRKLLEIPNVVIADPLIESRVLVERSRLVLTVWSFVGFEAALLRRPVIVFGTPLYGILPASMVRRVTDPSQLAASAADLMKNYSYDHEALVAFVAANMQSGVPLDFYSRFLGKRGRYTEPAAGSERVQFDRFIQYTVDRIYAVQPHPAAAPA